MGKASRSKKEREKMTSQSKKVLKQLKRESVPDVFVINGKSIYYNPLKRILNGEKYLTDDGVAVTQDMVKKYDQFLKTKMAEYKIKKEKENGETNSGNESEN